VPSGYRDLPPGQAEASGGPLLGDQKWSEVFQDKTLQGLIRTAIEKNYDARIAAARVLEAQAQLGITRADQFPSLGGSGNVTAEKSAAVGPFPSYQTNLGELELSGAWNLDFWGKYRRATEAARASLLANEWAQREVIATVVASVASSYFQLRELDLELEISRRTLDSRKQSLDLTRTLTEHGIDTLLDQRQAEELVYTAGAQIPDFERQVAQQENAISILLGNNPGDVPRGLKLTEQPHPPEVPAGLPSALLERRPDVREAEENLVAANARIGVARAAYFPQISLTGSGGYESAALSSLFSGSAGLWNVGAALTQPIFEGGRLRSGVELAEAQRQELTLSYQQTIQGAFRDVSNALIAYQKNREFRMQEEQLTASAQDAAQLSEMRFKAGATDYLEVLTNETNSFSDELTLVQAQFNELQALVQLYQALGGGWQQ
jgi:multidrug efflux system outer membrane protein